MAVPEHFAGLIVRTFGAPAELATLRAEDLPAGDVTVRVEYSSLNYKDGLAVTSRGKVLRQFPCVPGIDLAGVVEESTSDRFAPGDRVLATGSGLGESIWGGYARYARLPGAHLLPIPTSLDARRAMAIGTAGFTSALSVLSIQDHGIAADSGRILVTGAAGGVGSMALLLLRALGYRTAASTGRPELADYLRGLGAEEIVSRAELAQPAKPIESARWAGAIDSVGGQTLAKVLAQMQYGGAVAACGLAGGADLVTTVIPFILRSVSLLGINSVDTPHELRERAWEFAATHVDLLSLDALSTVRPLSDVPALADEILAGKIRGRTVIEVD